MFINGLYCMSVFVYNDRPAYEITIVVDIILFHFISHDREKIKKYLQLIITVYIVFINSIGNLGT